MSSNRPQEVQNVSGNGLESAPPVAEGDLDDIELAEIQDFLMAVELDDSWRSI